MANVNLHSEKRAKPGHTSCARLGVAVLAGRMVPAFAAILRRLAGAIKGLSISRVGAAA